MNKCEKLTGYILSEQYLSGYLQLSSESGGILPSGTRVITEPGIYDVYNYAKADVRIQKPTGNYNITSNGKYHIPEYEYVTVNVANIDTSDGTATPDKMDRGTIAYSKGMRVVGAVDTYEADRVWFMAKARLSENANDIACTTFVPESVNLKAQSITKMLIPKSDFGTATEGDVKQGITFTSAAGLKKTGTYVPSGGGGGIDTSDGTATPDTMDRNVVAYSKGQRVVGTVSAHTGGYVPYSSENKLYVEDAEVCLKYTFLSNNNFKKGSYVRLCKPLADFGDATADDVAQGKTFTSAAGLKVTGAYVPSGGGDDPMKASATVATTATATGDTLLLSGNSYLVAHKDDPKLVVTIICATALTAGVTYATASNASISGNNKFVTVYHGGIGGSAVMQSTGALNTAETGNFGRLYLNASGDLYFHSYIGGSSWQQTSVAIQAGTYTVFYGLLN